MLAAALEKLNEVQLERELLGFFEFLKKRHGKMPAKAYYKKTEVFPTPYAEISPIVKTSKGYEILLEHRPKNDPYWPSQWCTQGITILGRDTMRATLSDHSRHESGILNGASRLDFAGAVSYPKLRRGHAVTLVFIRYLKKKPKRYRGSWHPLDKLPQPFIKHMYSVTNLIKNYLKTKKPAYVEYLGK